MMSANVRVERVGCLVSLATEHTGMPPMVQMNLHVLFHVLMLYVLVATVGTLKQVLGCFEN